MGETAAPREHAGRDDSPAQDAAGDLCPGCDTHCPLDDPQCDRGEVYALRLSLEKENTGMEEQQPPSAMTNSALVNLFRHASKLMARAFHRGDHGHHAQELVLSIVRKRGPMNQRELLDLLDVRSASLSEVLGKLERHGLIARERDEEDKRNYVISVTEQGNALASRLEDARGESADALFVSLSDQERETLGNLLRKIIVSLADDPLGQDGPHGHHGHGCEHGMGHGLGHGRRPWGRGPGGRSPRDG